MAATLGAGVVHEAEAASPLLDNESLGKLRLQRGLVDVPVHGRKRREGAEVGEHRPRDEVARMQDQLGPPEKAEARLGQTARPARQVRVADERDQEGALSTKRPSR